MLTDQELAKRVKAALHADPYFYDGHVGTQPIELTVGRAET
jgi:hypothetical protein